MLKIAAAIITLNEERNIERCIIALAKCVDEIVVLDSFSSDRTEQICKKHKVRFIQKKWQGYSKTKNQLNNLIDADYIFSVDADEAPDQELIDDLLRQKEKGFKGIYEINRKTNYCGQWIRYCGWYPEYKMRLFPKDTCRWIGDFVHETLDYDNQFQVHTLKGHLNHFSYYNIVEHKNKALEYSKLSAKKYFKAHKKTFLLQPELSAIMKFISVFFLKRGFLDGNAGFQIAKISASANRYKYKMLKQLNSKS